MVSNNGKGRLKLLWNKRARYEQSRRWKMHWQRDYLILLLRDAAGFHDARV